MKKFFILLLVSVAMNSWSKEGGNGGDALVCRDSGTRSITSAEVLDYYEGEVLRDIVPVLSDKISVEENMEILFRNFSKASPNRVKIYRKWFADFYKEAKIIPGIVLVDIPDSGHLAFRIGCAVEQVIVQQVPKYVQDKRYIISADIWNSLKSSSKAGLIMHEMILRELIQTKSDLGLKEVLDTVDVRYLNSLIASGALNDQTVGEFNELLETFEFFKFIDVEGFSELITTYDLTAHDPRFSYVSKVWESGAKYFEYKNIRLSHKSLFRFRKVDEVIHFEFHSSSFYQYLDGKHTITLREEGFKAHPEISEIDVSDVGTAWLSLKSSSQTFDFSELLGFSDHHGCLKIRMNGYANVAADFKEGRVLSYNGSFGSCGLRFESSDNPTLFDEEGIPNGNAKLTLLANGISSVKIADLDVRSFVKQKIIWSAKPYRLESNLYSQSSNGGNPYQNEISQTLLAGSRVTFNSLAQNFSFRAEGKTKVCDYPGYCNQNCHTYSAGTEVLVHSNQQLCYASEEFVPKL